MVGAPRLGVDGANDMNLSMTFTGGPEMQRTLNALPDAVARRVQLRALREGAEVIQGAAEGYAPRRTGELADRIVINTVTKSAGDFDEATVAVGPAVSVFYGRFQELADEYGGVHHRAQPFMRPAFDARWREALSIIKTFLWSGIERAVKRAGRA